MIVSCKGLPLLTIAQQKALQVSDCCCGSAPGVASGVMRLDAYALAGIMQCIITQWNDPYLVSLNSNTMYVSTCIHWCDDHLSVSCWIVNLENCTWSYVLSAVKPSE